MSSTLLELDSKDEHYVKLQIKSETTSTKISQLQFMFMLFQI